MGRLDHVIIFEAVLQQELEYIRSQLLSVANHETCTKAHVYVFHNYFHREILCPAFKAI